MFDTTITWGDLLTVVLFILAAGVLFYLLLAIANLVGILKNIKKIFDKNRSNIDNTLEKLPEITDNVTKVSDIVREEMESIQKVIGNVGKITDSAKDAVEIFKKDVLVKAKGILDIIDWIRKLFEKDDKKKDIVYKYKYKPKEETVEQEVTGESSNDNIKKDKQVNINENIENNECNKNKNDSDNRKKKGEEAQLGENQQGVGI